MKLYITTPSPFARKVRIVAREKGLSDRIEEVVVDPYANAPELLSTNPVVQVPTLIAEDGEPLNDSPVICEYLDRLGGGDDLLPPSGSAEWLRVKRLETLGNQALEMGVKLVLEKRRPESERSPMWIDRWTTNMGRALDALEAETLSADNINIGTITAGIAVTWIGFRHPDYNWKTGRPNLVAFQQAIEARESFVATFPK
ncbi:glutathione S-transferase N-terminal domain-containing protein [uncultured Brevundimonas sp.]|uniref:glutathione S-transferase N-terminal domain-containing protein n=1 Tax=uncultured Brevundimonas sp. TaxID=213418 RepID=UPI00260B43E8|nr:glutathione S-transferase N-terminal domain-containing protein [uncultured Brevundimonas sp.]